MVRARVLIGKQLHWLLLQVCCITLGTKCRVLTYKTGVIKATLHFFFWFVINLPWCQPSHSGIPRFRWVRKQKQRDSEDWQNTQCPQLRLTKQMFAGALGFLGWGGAWSFFPTPTSSRALDILSPPTGRPHSRLTICVYYKLFNCFLSQ